MEMGPLIMSNLFTLLGETFKTNVELNTGSGDETDIQESRTASKKFFKENKSILFFDLESIGFGKQITHISCHKCIS